MFTFTAGQPEKDGGWVLGGDGRWRRGMGGWIAGRGGSRNGDLRFGLPFGVFSDLVSTAYLVEDLWLATFDCFIKSLKLRELAMAV